MAQFNQTRTMSKEPKLLDDMMRHIDNLRYFNFIKDKMAANTNAMKNKLIKTLAPVLIEYKRKHQAPKEE